jgi:cation diffusion facilitator family transporter
MPDPQPHPQLPQIQRVGLHTLIAGVLIMAVKFGVFALTNSAAVLSDALESIINVVAAGAMLYTIWLSNRPADREHPYGHGKIEFMTVGLEGWLILIAGLLIAYEASRRLIVGVEPVRLDIGIWLLGGVGVLVGALAAYVWTRGRKYHSDPLIADGKHLATDAASTMGVLLGLILVQYTKMNWLDPLVAIVMAGLILFTSWRLLWQSFRGLMDESDPADDAAVTAILDDEKASGTITGYHKVRLRHNGSFHWIDMHLQVAPQMTVAESHALASRIEGRIETHFEPGQANATAHLEPALTGAASLDNNPAA